MHMVVREMSVLQVPIVARRPAHPGGYAGLPVEVYRIWWVLANIEQCCGGANERATTPADAVDGMILPLQFVRLPVRE